MHNYRHVIVNWLCDTSQVDRSQRMFTGPEAAYRCKVQERYTGKGHDLIGPFDQCSGQLTLTVSGHRHRVALSDILCEVRCIK